MGKQLMVVLDMPIIIPKKTKVDGKCTLSMNWYRNAHHFESSKVKGLVKDQVEKYLIETKQDKMQFNKPVRVCFQYFKRTAIRTDTSNFFAVGAKFVYDALVELGVIPDDDSEFIVYEEQLKTIKDKEHPRMVFKFEEAGS